MRGIATVAAAVAASALLLASLVVAVRWYKLVFVDGRPWTPSNPLALLLVVIFSLAPLFAFILVARLLAGRPENAGTALLLSGVLLLGNKLYYLTPVVGAPLTLSVLSLTVLLLKTPRHSPLASAFGLEDLADRLNSHHLRRSKTRR